MIGELIGAAASLFAGNKQNKANEQAAARQYEQQKEFAQSGIQWKVEDAKKAGIHPLYAMGANTISYSPQSVGGADYSHLANAGQNIGRAIDATRSNPEKTNALLQTAQRIQMEGYQLDNDLKKVQLASAMATARQAGSAPGLPSTSTVPALVGMPGQGDAPQIDGPTVDITGKYNPVMPNTGGTAEYGSRPEVTFTKTPSGGHAVNVPQQLSESFESDLPGLIQWYYRNKYAPAFSLNAQTRPNAPIDKDKMWLYNPLKGEYEARRPSKHERRPYLKRGHYSWR